MNLLDILIVLSLTALVVITAKLYSTRNDWGQKGRTPPEFLIFMSYFILTPYWLWTLILIPSLNKNVFFNPRPAILLGILLQILILLTTPLSHTSEAPP